MSWVERCKQWTSSDWGRRNQCGNTSFCWDCHWMEECSVCCRVFCRWNHYRSCGVYGPSFVVYRIVILMIACFELLKVCCFFLLVEVSHQKALSSGLMHRADIWDGQVVVLFSDKYLKYFDQWLWLGDHQGFLLVYCWCCAWGKERCCSLCSHLLPRLRQIYPFSCFLSRIIYRRV